MEALKQRALVSVEDYLAGEKDGEVRHEYLGGVVYAMAGASENHITISMNIAFALRQHLKGSRCRALMHETKARLSVQNEEAFYYPDVMVYCDPRDNDQSFKRFPKVVIEVLSPATESIDRREKFLNYRRIETLEEYVLVAQDKMEVTVFQRASQWEAQFMTEATQMLRLPSLGFAMTLDAVYDSVDFKVGRQ